MLKKIIVILVLAIPTCAYCMLCDLNGDGLEFTIADLVFLNIIMQSPDTYSVCDYECDLDEDGKSLTVADIILIPIFLINRTNPTLARELSRHPDQDSLIIGSALAAPGEHISIPIHLTTVDTLMGYELYAMADTEYITLDSFAIAPNMPINGRGISAGSIHIIAFSGDIPIDSLFLMPGAYHLGDLYISVKDNIDRPTVTYIMFSGCPEGNFHTGFANLAFFEPVLVHGKITIAPSPPAEKSDEIITRQFALEAYPNPFNSSVNISATSPVSSELIVYDILGRIVKTYNLKQGQSQIEWQATDNEGLPLSSGIYFIKFNDPGSNTIRRVVYSK